MSETSARAAALDWAQSGRLIVGGDFNLRRPLMPGFERAGSHWVDHVFVRGWRPAGSEVLDARSLSDHRPLAVDVAPPQ